MFPDANARGDGERPEHVYCVAITARELWGDGASLEALATRKSIVTQSMLDARKKAWAEAYEHTPHGKPVTLE